MISRTLLIVPYTRPLTHKRLFQTSHEINILHISYNDTCVWGTSRVGHFYVHCTHYITYFTHELKSSREVSFGFSIVYRCSWFFFLFHSCLRCFNEKIKLKSIKAYCELNRPNWKFFWIKSTEMVLTDENAWMSEFLKVGGKSGRLCMAILIKNSLPHPTHG